MKKKTKKNLLLIAPLALLGVLAFGLRIVRGA
jgi:hypothetical protein